MSKSELPNLSSIKEKLKIDKILNSISDMVEGVSSKPLSNVEASDVLGTKIAELDKLVCDLLEVHKRHAEDLSKIHVLLGEVFNGVNALRAEVPAEEVVDTSSSEADESSSNKPDTVDGGAEVSGGSESNATPEASTDVSQTEVKEEKKDTE